MEKGDYIRALEQVADEYDIKKWNNLKKPPRIKDMTDAEMRLVTEQIGDIQYIRKCKRYRLSKRFRPWLTKIYR